MGGRKSRDIPRPLARGRDRFEAWRRIRKRGTRIPNRLWTLAVDLAMTHGLNRTAAALNLDYYSLKRRVESATPATHVAVPPFVELAPPQTGPGECMIELEDLHGASMRVHLKGCDAPDLVALGRSFWNSE